MLTQTEATIQDHGKKVIFSKLY